MKPVAPKTTTSNSRAAAMAYVLFFFTLCVCVCVCCPGGGGNECGGAYDPRRVKMNVKESDELRNQSMVGTRS